MNPALPKTRIATQKGRAKKFEEMQNSLAKLNFRFGIARKGRAG